jgi:hypothetical protein
MATRVLSTNKLNSSFLKHQYFGLLLNGWAVGIKECFSYGKIKFNDL